MILKPVSYVTYGSDPEGFFRRNDGKILGSERILPEEGLKAGEYYKPWVVRDGIQFELNPQNSVTTGGLGAQIKASLKLLNNRMVGYPNVHPSFDGVVEVDRDELDALSEKSRVLGCTPSLNRYGEKPITVDVKTYRKRSGGGHIHLGLPEPIRSAKGNSLVDYRHDLVTYLDVFTGNTCVLLDRDPNAAERRENYGRAGEYRLTSYGLEYRTLSNFWMRNFSLMSLAFGMTHIAISILDGHLKNVHDYESELEQVINLDRVIEAIDKNDANLARLNFEALVPFLRTHLPKAGFVLTPTNIDKFLTFTTAVQADGFDRFFPTDVVNHWLNGRFVEFNDFLETI